MAAVLEDNTMALSTPAPRVLADALPGTWVRDVVLVLGGAAFVGLAAQVSIPLPFTPVPVTGQTFAVLMVGAGLGMVRGLISMAIYLLAGTIGVPWFAQGTTAVNEGVLTPTMGYIVGFVLAGALVGFLAERGWTRTPLRTAAAMILGNVVIYAVGVTWLKIALDATWGQAWAWGLQPFLWGDAVKIILAAGLFPAAWLGLTKLGLAPRENGEDRKSSVRTFEASADN
jgi:biotin transport system substrate-specific component